MDNSQKGVESDQKEQELKQTPAPNSKPKPEQKPFEDFINQDFIPGVINALDNIGIKPESLLLEKGRRPVTGDECWMVVGKIPGGRRFWLCFNSNKITSSKTFAIAENGSFPSVLESFLIDEKKTTCALLVSRLLQRLNGQKWLGAN